MHSILTLALSLLVSLGSEVPLGNSTPRPAVFNQTLLSVASNGRDFLAVWSDERSAGPTDRAALFAGRIDAAGRPLEAGGGHKVADSAQGRIIWNGNGYLLLCAPRSGAPFLQTLDDDGKPLGAQTKMDVAVPVRSFATNGRNLLVVQYSGQIWLNAFDGSVIWKELIGEPGDVSDIDVLPNGDYRFVALTQHRVLLVTIDGTTGFLKESRTLVTNADHMAAAFRDTRILLAWTEGPFAYYQFVDVTPGKAQFALDAGGAALSIGWDGHQFAIALATLDSLRITRISGDGRLLDLAPIRIPNGPTHNVLFANSATDVLMAGDTFNGTDFDVVARASQGFDDLAAARTNVIVTSAEAQDRPRVADGGLTLWQEQDLMAQRPGGTPHTIAQGDVTAGAGRGTASYLVALIGGTYPESLVLAKRVAFDGTPIDRDPVVIAASKDTLLSTPEIAFDGTNFFVVWGDNLGALYAVRVAQNGRAIDAQPIALTNLDMRYHAPATPRVVWSGTVFVVVWTDSDFAAAGISPAPPLLGRVDILRVTSAGQPLDARPTVVWEGFGVGGVALAANDSVVELVWSGAGCVRRLSLHDDGTPAAAVRDLTCGSAFNVDLAWDGSEYVSVWTDGNIVKGYRLDVDSEPFQVSPPGTQASQPSIAASASGATIAYLRIAPELPFGGAWRVFTRTLDVRAVPPRHRATH